MTLAAAANAAPEASTVPVQALKGVGPNVAQRLARLGIMTVQDALFHLPLRYQDRTQCTALGAVQVGDEVVVEGTISHAEVRSGRRKVFTAYLADGTGGLLICLFHYGAAQQQMLRKGARIRCFGTVQAGMSFLEMVHPELSVLGNETASLDDRLTPVYPSTEGLSQYSLRKVMAQALERLGPHTLAELLPDDVVLPTGIPRSLVEALCYVHRPPPGASLSLLAQGRHPAQQRLAFEELLAHHLSLRQLRAQMETQCAPPLHASGVLANHLETALPFTLTGAQQRVLGEIRADLTRAHPMHRLVQGDVGSGKTVVAALAAVHAIEAGYQVAVMAPTELLAEQHLQNFRAWLTPLGVTVEGLAGRQRSRARALAGAGMASGVVQVAVGTHALFQENVEFLRLGLVIIDEQHRFGVHQRLSLRDKGASEGGPEGRQIPHQLIMTATPIPRTLAMTVYADLDCSVIDELPPGRTPIETVVIPEERRAEVVERVQQACQVGRQAYWVCTLIDESELLAAQAAAVTAQQLQSSLPHIRIGLVHGRMSSDEKEQAMAAFKAGETQLLVATTVIEVGVDVANASLMIIENTERLGLSQLHQLRGRVGRGAAHSVCILLYHGPLSYPARTRLGVMRRTQDGFEIARQDMLLRGPGEVLGTRQSGRLQLHVADLLRDQNLIPRVEQAAQRLTMAYPQRIPLLIRRWLGEAARYGEV